MNITNFEIDFKSVYYEGITAATTLWKVVPMGYQLDSYVIENKDVLSAAQISIGTSSTTGEIIFEQTIPAASLVSGVSAFAISKIADSDIFINIQGSGDTFNGCTLNFTFTFKRFKPSH
jgi:hypothetical protein